MKHVGTVSNGVVILPPDARLPEGAQVRIEPIADAAPAEPVGKKLLALAGSVKDLPEDFAENQDHYIHGAPKRSAL